MRNYTIVDLDKYVNEVNKSLSKDKDKEAFDLVIKYKSDIGLYFTEDLYQAWTERDPDFKSSVKAADLKVHLNTEDENKVKEVKKILNTIWDYRNAYFKSLKLQDWELEPSAQIVKQYVNAYCLENEPCYKDVYYEYNKENAHYQKQFKAIELMMDKLKDDNSEYAVILKVSVLNALYSTNIRNIHPVVNEICWNGNFNEEVMEDDKCIELVERITNAKGADANYSFATKYCHIHNPENFPIYDSFAAGVLIFFHFIYRHDLMESNGKIKADDFEIIPTGHPDKKCSCTNLREKLKDYASYKAAINNFMKAYNLKPDIGGGYFSYQDIDKYLWGFGRKHNISVYTVGKKLNQHGVPKK